MEDALPSSPLRLTQPEAARMLTDPRARRFLVPFIGRERRVGEVAAQLGVDPSSVLYRVRQLERVGLVRMVRLEPRSGRALRYYRAVADNFFIPFAVTTYDAAEDLSPETFRPMQEMLERSVGSAWSRAAGVPLGLSVKLVGPGRVSFDIVPDADGGSPSRFFEGLLEAAAPAVWDSWGIRRLSPEDAKALQRELATVFRRYAPAEGTHAQEYIVRLAMAPVR